MLILVDPHSGVPVYRQVIDQVRFQIAAGRLVAGEELPSTRALSLHLGVNPMTISKAYGILEEEGILDRRPGLPLVVSAQSENRLRQGRLNQLRAALDPAATAALQLGFDAEDAAAVLRTLVNERHGKVEEPV